MLHIITTVYEGKEQPLIHNIILDHRYYNNFLLVETPKHTDGRFRDISVDCSAATRRQGCFVDL